MADYYTHFSVMFRATENAMRFAMELYAIMEQRIQAADIETVAISPQYEAAVEELAKNDDWNHWVMFSIGRMDDGLWIYSDENGDPVQAAEFIRAVLEFIDSPLLFVTFEWANTCSKPRTDGFGGGAAIVSMSEIEMMSTDMWLMGAEERLRQKFTGEES
jgi:hypothetical protein